MIRIDEIYTTFLSYFKQSTPTMRMFVCDPFGRSDPDSLLMYGRDGSPENNYTLFFDQEPISLIRHKATFDRVKEYSYDLEYNNPATQGYIVTSEQNSESVEQICKQYGWRSKYYFFHGWAALDWYRGYNRMYVMPEPNQRTITKTFIMPNRIVAGERQHRLLLLYHIFKHKLTNNWISCPAVCPAEQVEVKNAIRPLAAMVPDIEDVFAEQQLPIDFPNESGSPMHSYCLSLFKESSECLLYLVTETVFHGKRLHLTEKTFKPICLRMPFIIAGTRGSLAYLRSYGFKTFNELWDESYDDEINDQQRIEKISWLLRSLDVLPQHEKQRLFNLAQEICEYNYNHFYNGGFESILWQELTDMLHEF